MYKVIYPFRDLQDRNEDNPNGKVYSVGDIFYNENASKKRLEELAGSKNKIGRPLIEKKEEEAVTIEDYHTGHGWYEYEGKKHRKSELEDILEGEYYVNDRD